jgi:hypothetical protein
VNFEFESGTIGCFTFILYFVGESCLLVSWCVGGRCGMACSDEDHGRSRRPGVEDWTWSHRLGTRWSGDAMCSLHCGRGDEKRGFLS